MEWSNRWLNAFCRGLEKHGIEPVRAAYEDGPISADVAVLYGVSERALMEGLKARGTRCLIMEMGYVGNRYRRQSLLWDGLNGRGWHPKANDGGRRWRRQFGKDAIRPWRTGGDYVLIVGQYAPDQSVRGMDVDHWYQLAYRRIRRTTDLPVKLKPHPLSDECGLEPIEIPGVEVVRDDIGQLIANATEVVTINSNVGVLAVLAGTPVAASDEGAMCWPVSGREVGERLTPDRTEWAAELAWAQWSIREIREGKAWAHVWPS